MNKADFNPEDRGHVFIQIIASLGLRSILFLKMELCTVTAVKLDNSPTLVRQVLGFHSGDYDGSFI
jgi:hypothetical protein